MNKNWRVALIAVTASSLLLVPRAWPGLQVLRLEGPVGTVFHWLEGGGDTVFASGFSDIAFLRVETGMPIDEVIRLLGEPLDTYASQNAPMGHAADGVGWDTGLRWSRSPGDSSYSVRVVLFRNGRVVGRVSEFYVD
jgi:hypothetical protein